MNEGKALSGGTLPHVPILILAAALSLAPVSPASAGDAVPEPSLRQVKVENWTGNPSLDWLAGAVEFYCFHSFDALRAALPPAGGEPGDGKGDLFTLDGGYNLIDGSILLYVTLWKNGSYHAEKHLEGRLENVAAWLWGLERAVAENLFPSETLPLPEKAPTHSSKALESFVRALGPIPLAEKAELLEKALRDDPRFAQASCKLALIRFHQQDYDRALKVFRDLLEEVPGHAGAQHNVRQCLARAATDLFISPFREGTDAFWLAGMGADVSAGAGAPAPQGGEAADREGERPRETSVKDALEERDLRIGELQATIEELRERAEFAGRQEARNRELEDELARSRAEAEVLEKRRAELEERLTRVRGEQQEAAAREVEFGGRLLEKAGQQPRTDGTGWEFDQTLKKNPEGDRETAERIEKLEASRAELEEKLSASKEKESDWKRRIAVLEADRAGLEERAEEHRARADILDAALDDRSRKVEELQGILDRLQKYEKKAAVELREREGTVRNSGERLTALEAELAGSRKEGEDRRSRIAELKERLSKLEVENSQFRKQAALLEEERSNMREQLARLGALEEEASRSAHEAVERADRVPELELELKEGRSRAATLEAELAAARTAVEEAKSLAREQESLAETLDDILVERDREIAEYQNVLEDFRGREAEAVEEHEGGLARAGEQIAELKSQLAEARREAEEAASRLREGRLQVEEYRSRSETLNESLGEKENRIRELQGLSENLPARERRIEDLEVEGQRLRSLNLRFAQKLKESTLRLLELERKLPGNSYDRGELRSQVEAAP